VLKSTFLGKKNITTTHNIHIIYCSCTRIYNMYARTRESLITVKKSLTLNYSIPSAKVAQGYTNNRGKRNSNLLTIFKKEATP
jgi:hypothetical protein